MGSTHEVAMKDTMCILSSGDRSQEPLLKPMLKKHVMTGRESKGLSECGLKHTLDITVQFRSSLLSPYPL